EPLAGSSGTAGAAPVSQESIASKFSVSKLFRGRNTWPTSTSTAPGPSAVEPHAPPRIVSGVTVVLTSQHLEVLRFTYEHVEFDTRLREADDLVAEYWPTFGSIQYP